MYKVYGTFFFVPGLDLCASGLDLNADKYTLIIWNMHISSHVYNGDN